MKKKKIQKVISTTLTTPAYSKETGGSVKLDLHDGSCNNYLDSGPIARILRWQHYQPVVHWVTSAVFILIIYSGLTNGNDQKFVEGSVFATAFVWDIWHPLLAFTILFIGRFWCSVCPLGAIHGLVSRNFSLNHRYPEKFRNLWIAIALFIFITATERHLFRFTRNPEATAYLLLTFLLIAIVMGLVYEKRTFCRYICPTGLVLAVLSMISGSELRCRSKEVCKAHKEKECLTGNSNGHGCPMHEFPQTMERNNFCIYCTDCIKTCSKNNIRVSKRPFGQDILTSKKGSLDESFFIHSLIVMMLFLMGMEHTPFRNIIKGFVLLLGIDRNIMALVILTGLSIAAILIVYALQWTNTPQHAKKRLISYSYAFIPLGLATYMAWNVFKLFRGIFYGIYELTHWAGLHIISGNPSINFETLNNLQIIILLAGFIFSLWMGFQLTADESKSTWKQNGLFPIILVMGVYAAAGMWILTLPVLT